MDTNKKRCVLVGGTPSSASTLLAALLNSHPKVLCGPETNLFSHSFEFLQGHLDSGERNWIPDLDRGKCWAPIVIPSSFYNTNLTSLLGRIHNLKSNLNYTTTLMNCLYEGCDGYEGVEILAEKSPPNIYQMASALDADYQLKVIITVRDPASIVNSMCRRGFPAPVAWREVSLCFQLAAVLLQGPHAHRIKVIRAEDLTRAPNGEVRKIFNFFGIDAFPQKIIDNPRCDISLEGWSHNVKDKILEIDKAPFNFEQFLKIDSRKFASMNKLLNGHSSSMSFSKAIKFFGYGSIKYTSFLTLNGLQPLKKLRRSRAHETQFEKGKYINYFHDQVT